MNDLGLSPLVVNTLGGLVIALILVFFVKQLTLFVKEVKVNKGGAMEVGMNGGQRFETSRAFLNHCEKTDTVLLTVKESLIRHDNLDRHFKEMIAALNKQTELLQSLVTLRKEYIKKGE